MAVEPGMFIVLRPSRPLQLLRHYEGFVLCVSSRNCGCIASLTVSSVEWRWLRILRWLWLSGLTQLLWLL